jgi:hypothetical protein
MSEERYICLPPQYVLSISYLPHCLLIFYVDIIAMKSFMRYFFSIYLLFGNLSTCPAYCTSK